MHHVLPRELDAQFHPKNPVFRWFVVGGMILWAVVLTIHFGFGNFSPIKARSIEFDGTNEYTFEQQGTAAIYALALVVAAYLAITTAGSRLRFSLFTIFVLLTLGEEIDWGQVYLHFPTPEFIAAHSKTGMFNLHNLKGIGFFYIFLFAALPVLAFLGQQIWRAWKKKEPLSRALLWCFSGILFIDLLPAQSILHFQFAWLILGYLVLMLHLRYLAENKDKPEKIPV